MDNKLLSIEIDYLGRSATKSRIPRVKNEDFQVIAERERERESERESSNRHAEMVTRVLEGEGRMSAQKCEEMNPKWEKKM